MATSQPVGTPAPQFLLPRHPGYLAGYLPDYLADYLAGMAILQCVA
jgi:hypothetical protein